MIFICYLNFICFIIEVIIIKSLEIAYFHYFPYILNGTRPFYYWETHRKLVTIWISTLIFIITNELSIKKIEIKEEIRFIRQSLMEKFIKFLDIINLTIQIKKRNT